MTTRWAYEAMTVEQFKNNRYQQYFFEEDMKISQNDWYASFLIPELTQKIKECELAGSKEIYRDNAENNFYKLKRYIGELSSISEINNDDLISSLSMQK